MTKVNLRQERERKRRLGSTPNDGISELEMLGQPLNRRAWLKRGLCLPLASILAACRQGSKAKQRDDPASTQSAEGIQGAENENLFDPTESRIIQSVQQILLPDDGNGPDAKAIRAFDYLNGAMNGQENADDGQLVFIKEGTSWLADLSRRTQGDDFLNLPTRQQEQLLKRFSESADGENWLYFMMFYLIESLLADPIYGGNPGGIGWKWLEHQPGFPRPVAGKTYRDFI